MLHTGVKPVRRKSKAMRLYLAYASEDFGTAEQVHLALLSDRHEVFFDQRSLHPGDDFDRRFRDALWAADMLIFLASPSSVQHGCYALTELGYARERWPHPQDHVLPVIVAPVPIAALPAYLRAITILEPQGNIAAEIAQAVRMRQALLSRERSRRMPLSLTTLMGLVVTSALLAISLGTVFSFLYPRVEIDFSVAMLFLIVAICSVLGMRALWRMLRS